MKNCNYQFDFIASTGRTATTYLASALNSFDGVASCHEGYLDSDKLKESTLELINLENNQAYRSKKNALTVVQEKRSADKLKSVQERLNVSRIFDVAYYNSTICEPLLSTHKTSRMLGIIRDCESFVRSATTLVDEDPLPVGWPDPNKHLTPREKFIGMGRLKPAKTSKEFQYWGESSAIHRNIWLWKETNKMLCEARVNFPDRVRIARFETFQSNQSFFWESLIEFFEMPTLDMTKKSVRSETVNKKPFGYQIGPSGSWGTIEREFLKESQHIIDELANYDF